MYNFCIFLQNIIYVIIITTIIIMIIIIYIYILYAYVYICMYVYRYTCIYLYVCNIYIYIYIYAYIFNIWYIYIHILNYFIYIYIYYDILCYIVLGIFNWFHIVIYAPLARLRPMSQSWSQRFRPFFMGGTSQNFKKEEVILRLDTFLNYFICPWCSIDIYLIHFWETLYLFDLSATSEPA